MYLKKNRKSDIRVHRLYNRSVVSHVLPILCILHNFCLFVLRLNVPVNNHVGTEPPLPWFNHYCRELMCLARHNRTQHGAACGNRTQDLTIWSPTLYHYATALPILHNHLPLQHPFLINRQHPPFYQLP